MRTDCYQTKRLAVPIRQRLASTGSVTIVERVLSNGLVVLTQLGIHQQTFQAYRARVFPLHQRDFKLV